MNELITHLTSTQTDFNANIFEHDQLVTDNDYINIYNNQKEQAYHKFWFMLEDLSFINIYYKKNYNNIRFAFNNKTEKNMKFIKYFKDLTDHLTSIYKKIHPNNEVTVHYPWKEKENEYPYTILFLSNASSIMCDSNNQPFADNTFSTESQYTMIFEIANVAITKDIVCNAMTYNLQYKCFIKIVKKEPPINFLALVSGATSFGGKIVAETHMHRQQYYHPTKDGLFHLPLASASSPSSIEPSFSQQQTKQATPAVIRPQICLDPKTLLNMKQALRKTTTESVQPDEENKEAGKATQKDFLEVKSGLKNVATEEKTLLPHLVNEHKMKIAQQAVATVPPQQLPEPIAEVVVKKKKTKKATA
jgi:hypothetical protein